MASAAEATLEHSLPKELGLRDLVLAQVLCVVGASWVGVAAKLGKAHTVFWLVAMALFYVPLAIVVIYLNRQMPLEGGVYQWAKYGFGELLGFLTAWNLWIYAVVCVAVVLFVVPTDLSYMIGPGASWLPASRIATIVIVGSIVVAIAAVSIVGLSVGKWLHNVGGLLLLLAFVILIFLPIAAMFAGRKISYTPLPWSLPQPSWFSLAIFGQMTIGGLSGFEYVAIFAGECRNASRTIGRSVMISAPVIALMFILGTSSVLAFIGNQPINLIGPIPQTFRLAFGNSGFGAFAAPLAICLLITRAIACASLIFNGLSRLPMTAGWDHLLPTWFTRLHPRHRTPVNSILFVAGLVIVLLALSMSGVHEQEAMQLLQNSSSVHYGITYVALFAIPLFGQAVLRNELPLLVKVASGAGLFASAVGVAIAIHPIIEVESYTSYGLKIAGTVVFSNCVGLLIYMRGRRNAMIFAAQSSTLSRSVLDSTSGRSGGS